MNIAKAAATFLLLLILLTIPRHSEAEDLYLMAAASLKEVVDDLSNRFAGKNPGVRVVKNYGGSGALAMQLENGAPVDLFISANLQWVNHLKQKNLLSARTIIDFTYNTLVFAGRPDTKATSLESLVNLDRIAIGSPKSVPAGEYAMQAFRNARLDKRLAGKLVMAKDVRQCLMYAERGEVDGAVVYRTDALLAKNAKILFVVPQSLYDKVTYPMALTATGAGKREAQAFYRYLQSPEAKSILAKYGFSPR